MPSGKQTSFQFGEVSQLQKFKSNEIEYSNALDTLYNMVVKRTGGVSNRPGTIFIAGMENLSYIQTHLTDGDGSVLSEGEPIPIKTFQLKGQSIGDFSVTVCVDPLNTDTYEVYISTYPGQVAGRLYYSNPKFIEKLTLTYSKGWFIFSPTSLISSGSSSLATYGIFESLLPEWNATDTGITPFIEFNEGSDLYNNLSDFTLTSIGYSWIYNGGGSVVLFPVSYMITFETFGGLEVPILIFETENINLVTGTFPGTPANEIFYPSEDMTNFFTLNFDTGTFNGVPAGLARINLYRSTSMTGGLALGLGNYQLVGRAIPVAGSATVHFQDTGASIPSVTPPIDTSMQFLYSGGGTYLILGRYRSLIESWCMAEYQERLIMGCFGLGVLPAIKSGDCMISKLGASAQFSKPLVLRDTESFQFRVPTEKGARVDHLLSDKRLAAFTEDSVSIIAGGENGVISTTSINPLRISDEGVARYITPKMSGNYGVFINNSLNKLMALIFMSDGGVSIRELSKWSSHLIDFDICQLETVRGSDGEDNVYLLSRNGTLICATINEDGIAGFSRLEFPYGRVISIFRTKVTRSYDERFSRIGEAYDTLGLYIARNNFVNLEYLDERDDNLTSNNVFADCAIPFGAKLSFNGAAGYRQVVLHNFGITLWFPGVTEHYLNITPAVPGSWDAGDILELEFSSSLVSRNTDDMSIQVYYEDANGILKSVILYPIWSSESVGPPYTVNATCEEILPEELRDIDSLSIFEYQKNARKSRWLPASKNWGASIGSELESLYVSRDQNAFFDYNGTYDYDYEDGVQPVAIVGDGKIISSPNDPQFPTKNIEADSGSVDFEESFPFDVSFGYVGIPYESEMVTLPIEASDNRTFTDNKKLVNKVGLALYNTKEGYIGLPNKEVTDMEPLITNDQEDISTDDTVFSGHIAPIIPTEWTDEGKISVKQVNPAPMTVLAVYPKGVAGD